MNLNCEAILDFYTHKNRKVLLQIKVAPKSRNCRCLSQNQWKIFDEELEKIILAKDYWDDEKCIKFNIRPYIEVKVQKSKLSWKLFYKCLGIINNSNIGDEAHVKDSNLALECVIDFQSEVPLISPIQSQEYEPEIETSPNRLCTTLPYEPYKPSNKNLGANNNDINKSSGIDILPYNCDTYSPKVVFEIGVNEPLSTKEIPKYIPAPINAKGGTVYHSSNFKELIIKRDTKYNSLKVNLNKRKECEYVPKSQEVGVVEIPVYIPTPIEDKIPQKVFKTDNSKNNKKRSKTKNVFPERLDEKRNEEQISKIEELGIKEMVSKCYNKKLKKRSMTIDEISSALVDDAIYIPTLVDQPTLQNVLKPCEYRRSENAINTIDVFPKHLKGKYITNNEQMNIKEKYTPFKNKTLKNRSASVDQIPTELTESKNKTSLHQSIVEKNQVYKKCYNITSLPEVKCERILTASLSSEVELTPKFFTNSKKSSKIETLEGTDKYANDNKNGKIMKLQQLIDNSPSIDIATEKDIKRGRIMKASHAKINNSLRHSDRSTNKPKRLIEKHPSGNNLKKHKSSPKNKELFGTDDDDDDDCFENKKSVNTNNDKVKATTFEPPSDSKSSIQCYSLSSSAKKICKGYKSGENEQKKHDMTKPTFATKLS